MTDKLIAYPAIFKPLPEAEDHYFIAFPDLPDTFTEGHGLEDAYLMASDVLAEMNYTKPNLPTPSLPRDLVIQPNEFIVVISANLTAKRRALQRYVRKNVTVPAELAAAAEAQGINFSLTLTTALQHQLQK